MQPSLPFRKLRTTFTHIDAYIYIYFCACCCQVKRKGIHICKYVCMGGFLLLRPSMIIFILSHIIQCFLLDIYNMYVCQSTNAEIYPPFPSTAGPPAPNTTLIHIVLRGAVDIPIPIPFSLGRHRDLHTY